MEIKTTEDIINNVLWTKQESDLKEAELKKKWISVESLEEWIEKNKHLPKDSMMNKFVNELPV